MRSEGCFDSFLCVASLWCRSTVDTPPKKKNEKKWADEGYATHGRITLCEDTLGALSTSDFGQWDVFHCCL